jgi:hypothetical protein
MTDELKRIWKEEVLAPSMAARLRFQTEHVGFVVDKMALEQVFSEYFRVPCQSSFHQFLHHHNHPGLAQ